MEVFVLLYQSGDDEEGIHSLEIKNQTVVLMFQEFDDAERYCGLLEAQDFPIPTVEKVNRSEIEIFCRDAGYIARFVEKGFIPKTDEDRFLISPPQANLDVSQWDKESNTTLSDVLSQDSDELSNLKKKLEDLM